MREVSVLVHEHIQLCFVSTNKVHRYIKITSFEKTCTHWCRRVRKGGRGDVNEHACPMHA
jgi:hypothetical protein